MLETMLKILKNIRNSLLILILLTGNAEAKELVKMFLNVYTKFKKKTFSQKKDIKLVNKKTVTP
jgi:hypothetical protein